MIREWRIRRQMSLGALSLKTGVHKATLSRWESGAQKPRVAELEATLEALSVPSAQRRQALVHVQAPRAVVRLRDPAGGPLTASPPTAGDLLRALRLRRGWTLERLETQTGIPLATIARWERAEQWPDATRLHTLCNMLHAHPEEVTALTGGDFWLEGVPTETGDLDPFFPLLDATYLYFDGLRDLRFFSLEAKLWHRGQHDPRAHALLRLTCAFHARALMETNRAAEAAALVQRWRKEAPPDREDGRTLAMMLLVAAWGASHRHPDHAVPILKDAIGSVQDHDYRSWLLADLAIYVARAGHGEAAMKLGELAYDAAQRTASPHTPWFRQRDMARILIASKRYAAALDCLDAAGPLLQHTEDAEVRHRLLAAECWLGLGKKQEAQERLEGAGAVIDSHGLDYLRPQAEALARQF
jgi:transcriptional regulator with XRE-family HTH domain